MNLWAQLNRLSGTLPYGLIASGENLERHMCHVEGNRFQPHKDPHRKRHSKGTLQSEIMIVTRDIR